MPYTPVPYTDINTVKRLLRTQNNQITISDDEANANITVTDVNAYILDASRFIDSLLFKHAKANQIPLTQAYPEIQFAAGRITAFFIYRDFYAAYRLENLPMGPRGWVEDAKEYVRIFIDNLNEGIYPGLSPATNGPSWETTAEWLISMIGNYEVHEQNGVVDTQVPISGENITPYPEPPN